MSPWRIELLLILRSRMAVVALALLLVVTTLSVLAGLHAVSLQQQAIDRALLVQEEELARQRAHIPAQGEDPGNIGYYTFHATWDRPPPLAFLALGQRDVQPSLLRVRLLGLQAQLYESEAFNPELSLAGTFDFSFVLVFLVPLVAIALTHDLVSSERESGRLRLLLATAGGRNQRVFVRRGALRYLLVLLALVLPVVAGLTHAGAWSPAAFGILALAALYTAFWFALSAAIATLSRSSATSAMVAMGVWLVSTLLLPTVANTAINRGIPASKGVDMMLAQRQLVHGGWDLPKEATFERFFRTHPQWSDTAPVTGRFHWKWYYAMHQAGDEAVAPQVAEYRDSLLHRQQWSDRSGLLLPGIGAQGLIHRLADTDLRAQLDYQDSITAYHGSLRHYFYPYLFRERPFFASDFDHIPAYAPRTGKGGSSGGLLTSAGFLLAFSLLLLALTRWRLRGIPAS